MKKILLGIDGGGTYTRVAITDTVGNLLASIKYNGSANAHQNPKAKESVFHAVTEAIQTANCTLDDVIGIGAGISGYDSESDRTWVEELTHIDGLNCPIHYENDAVIAHKGAFLSKPGIISIAGTGAIIFGITETGRHIRNYDFYHYARTAAWALGQDTTYRILADETGDTDSALVESALAHFGMAHLADFVQFASTGFAKDPYARTKAFSDFAPIITQAATNGSQLAKRCCLTAVEEMITGVRLVGACFEKDTVPVALIGSVANSPFMHNAIQNHLTLSTNKKYTIVQPAVEPVLGAVLMAMELTGITLTATIEQNLCFRSL